MLGPPGGYLTSAHITWEVGAVVALKRAGEGMELEREVPRPPGGERGRGKPETWTGVPWHLRVLCVTASPR